MLKVLLAGLGVRGRYWAEVINRSDHAETVAYVDPQGSQLERACNEFGDRLTYDTVKSALRAIDEVDALVLANPPIGREEIVRLAVFKAAIRNVFPMQSTILRFPHTTTGVTHVVEVWSAYHTGHGVGSSSSERTDVSPFQTFIHFGVEGGSSGSFDGCFFLFVFLSSALSPSRLYTYN